jgi:hypothetical protein
MSTKSFLIALALFLLLFSTVNGKGVSAEMSETQSILSMPEEYVNYTIAAINENLWAKIDGTYPIYYTGSEEALPMVYPTPPGTTNIHLWLDDVELGWSNYTQVYPEATHHTGIGDWPMILSVLEPVPDQFVLRIHYEHPVQVINGSYMFLYDLNIKDYLSVSAPKSTAYFTIMMNINFTDLDINTVSVGDERLSPINYSVAGANPAEITLRMVSEYDKPLLGDLLVSFKEAELEEPNDMPNLLLVYAAAVAVGLATVGVVAYVFFRRLRRKLL